MQWVGSWVALKADCSAGMSEQTTAEWMAVVSAGLRAVNSVAAKVGCLAAWKAAQWAVPMVAWMADRKEPLMADLKAVWTAALTVASKAASKVAHWVG